MSFINSSCTQSSRRTQSTVWDKPIFNTLPKRSQGPTQKN